MFINKNEKYIYLIFSYSEVSEKCEPKKFNTDEAQIFFFLKS